MASHALSETPVLLDPLAVLPLALSRRILSSLPADSRGRAACVSLGWRDALADPALWERLYLLPVPAAVWGYTRNDHAVLFGAAIRARGQLRHLDMRNISVQTSSLMKVLAANAESFRMLVVCALPVEPSTPRAYLALDAIVAAAPMLQVLEVSETVTCCWDSASRLMSSAVLRLNSLMVRFDPRNEGPGGLARIGPFTNLLSDLSLQPAVRKVYFCDADLATPQGMSAIVDAVLARRLPELYLYRFTPPHAASLARLFAGDAVAELCFSHQRGFAPLLDAAGAALVGEALRNNTTLTALSLKKSGLFRDGLAAQTLMGALVAHPSLRSISLMCEEGDLPEARGSLFAALIAADAPALQLLDVSCDVLGSKACNCALGDAGLGPLVDALPRNHYLRALNLSYLGISENFARQRLLLSVRLNTGLLKLKIEDHFGHHHPAALEAENLVASRPGAPPRD